jgi:virginiamycin B lyase
MTVGVAHRWWRARLARFGAVMLGTFLVPAVLPGSTASAGGGVFTSFTDPTIDMPQAIVAGPDGALWFANFGNDSIGRITTTGVVTNYTGTGIDNPESITSGPDGGLWFTNLGTCAVQNPPCDPGSIGRITTSGLVTIYTDPTIYDPSGITAGPDGALWFINQSPDPCGQFCGSVGRITTSGVVSNFTSTIPNAIDNPTSLTAGPDGALWYANGFGHSVGRITTKGTITVFANSAAGPHSITAGPDGALWFTNDGGGSSSIGRITTSGTASDYPQDYPDSTGISAGPDGALWYVDPTANDSGGAISRITPSGTITSYKDPSIDYPFDITTGPDGNEWFVNTLGNSIDRLTTNDSVTVSPTLGPAGTPVTISGAGFSAGETVKVKYLTAKAGAKVLLCKATAAPDGTFSCLATIPANAGIAGTHTIQAKGSTSGTVPETLYLRIT